MTGENHDAHRRLGRCSRPSHLNPFGEKVSEERSGVMATTEQERGRPRRATEAARPRSA